MVARGAEHISRCIAVVLGGLVLTSGCSSMMSSATAGLADSLTSAVLDQNEANILRGILRASQEAAKE